MDQHFCVALIWDPGIFGIIFLRGVFNEYIFFFILEHFI